MSKKQLRSIYDRHKEELWRYSLYLTKNQDEAEDLLQETFARFIPVFLQKRVEEEGLYLRKILRNLYYDDFRRKKIEQSTLSELKTMNDRNPEKVLDEKSRVTGEILSLRLIHQMGIQEIASTMQLSRWTISRRLKLALRRLRKEFEHAGILPEDLE